MPNEYTSASSLYSSSYNSGAMNSGVPSIKGKKKLIDNDK